MMMDQPITWGILGTGDIARQMAEDLRLVPGAELRAVASRSQDRAYAFADTHEIPVRYGDYESLVRDPAIDVVYIATPHPRHCADTLLCLEHGKHVLCEKPLAMNAAQAARMVDAARTHGLFLMEALWTAFFPAIRKVRETIAAGTIGNVRLVVADFSYRATAGPESRLFNLELGGGALLDIGIYTVVLADMVYGQEPERIQASWSPAETGVDESAAMILDFGDGRRALLSTSLAHDAPQEALIAGENGVIRIPHRFSQPDAWSLDTGGGPAITTFERTGYGYHLEAREVTECVRQGRFESPIVPHAMSLRIARTLDRIRQQWGLRYPADETDH